ncbi:MAG TPA: hypothetical protein VKH43_07785 [Thermoanaerobaculia bacterium]|nr:hypothetical protein [Thermoanaerobaculia bacterium]
MAGVLAFGAAQAALAALGFGAAWHPSVRPLSALSRAAVAFCAGAVFLTLEGTAYSMLGIPWSFAGLALPLLLLSFAAMLRWRRVPTLAPPRIGLRSAAARWSVVIGALALVYLAVAFGSSAGTSVDYLLFWGVKAVKYADNRGIDPAFLRSRFAIHAVPEYPPLIPVVHGWGALAAGRLPWRVVPLVSAIPIAAAIPILLDRCRRRAGDAGAAVIAALWTVAISLSVVQSFSAGGAEPMILFFETVALVWLLTEHPGESRFVPTLALCGAALTKVEGTAAVFFVAFGAYLLSRGREGRRGAARAASLLLWPLASVGTWFLYQKTQSLEVGYHSHGDLLMVHADQLGTVVKELLRNLEAGSLWIAWGFAAAVVLLRVHAWRSAAPALTLAAGLLAFLAFDYLHDGSDPTQRIVWTAPRVTQSALSAVILAAGMLSLGKAPVDGPEAPPR